MPFIRRLAYGIVLLVITGLYCASRAYAADAFPGVPPEQIGMDAAKLEQARHDALSGGGSGCIIRGGKLVMAWGDQKQKYDIYSSTKSVAVTALGLAIRDNKVQLHDTAKKYLVSDDPRFNQQHNTNLGCFGMFESIDDQHVANSLLTAATDGLRNRDRNEIMGPIDYSTNYRCQVCGHR